MSNFHSFSDFNRGGGARGRSEAPKSGVVTVVDNDDMFLELQEACVKTGKLTVVDMNATWCGPCRMMKPVLEDLSRKYPDVIFLDVDVDKCQETARKVGVSSIPAFLLFKGTEQVGQVVGANQGQLRALVERHHVPAAGAAEPVPSGGVRLGDGPAPAPAPAAGPVVPDPTLCRELMEMGFSEAQAKAALVAVNNRDLCMAVDWITEHPDVSVTPQQPQQQQQPQVTPDMVAAAVATAAAAAAAGTTTTAPAAPQVVHDALCNYCQKQIVGVRYKCTVCPDFDMCQECRDKGLHDAGHALTEIRENVRPKMTAAEVELKKRELQQRLEQKRSAEAEAEKQRAKQRELERRRAGHDLQDAKERFEASQARKADIARKKEAQEAQAAKERVRLLIEQDKLERRARLAGEDPDLAASSTAAAAAQQQPKQHIVVPRAPLTTVAIQVRLPDGTNMRHDFAPTATVNDVYTWVATSRTDNVPPGTSFSLLMLAPRRIYGPRDMDLTLVQADLAPRAALIATTRRA